MAAFFFLGMWAISVFLIAGWLRILMRYDRPTNLPAWVEWSIGGLVLTCFALIAFWGIIIVKIDNHGLPSVTPLDGGLAVIGGILFPFFMIGYFFSGKPIMGCLLPFEVRDWIEKRCGVKLIWRLDW